MNSLFTSPYLIIWSTNWVFHWHLQNTSGHLTPPPEYNLNPCNQQKNSYGNIGILQFTSTPHLHKNFCKILYQSTHLSEGLGIFFLHVIPLLNHSFWIFLPGFLHLNLLYSVFHIFWKLQYCVSSLFTWTFRANALLHVFQRTGRSGENSTRRHDPSFFPFFS